MATAEQRACESIDELFEGACSRVRNLKLADTHAGRGVALREFLLINGFGYAAYLFHLDRQAAGFIEAKRKGIT